MADLVGMQTNPFPNNSANLETCPFCGFRAVMDKAFQVTRSSYSIQYEARFRFRCGNGWCSVRPTTDWRETEAEAREVWNRRA